MKSTFERINEFPKSSAIYIWYVCNTVILVTLLLMLNIGIELRDEGYYLQGYLRGQPIYFNHSGFQFIVRLLPFSDDIIMARFYRIILHIITGIGLAWSIQKYVLNHTSFRYLAAVAVLGNFLSYVFSPLSISYNSLNLIFIQLLLALYLNFRRVPFLVKNAIMLPLIIFGIVLGLVAYNKVTSAAFLVLILCLDQFALRYNEKKQLFAIISIIAVVSFTVFAGFIFFTFGKNYLIGIYLGTKSYSPFDDGHNSLIFILKQIFINPIQDFGYLFLFSLAFMVVYLVAQKFNKSQHLIVQAIYGFIMLAVFYQFRNVYNFVHTGAEYIVGFYLFVIIAFLYRNTFNNSVKNEKINLPFALALFLLPVAGFFGSDNRPMLGLSHYMLFCLLLIVYLNQWLKMSFISFAFPILLTGFLLNQILIDPYHNPSVFEQNNKITICGKRFYVSKEVYKQVTEFEKIKPYISSQKPIIPIALSNGILYINDIPSFYTFQYNNVHLMFGYIQLLLGTEIPSGAQILINRKEDNVHIKNGIQQLLAKAENQGLKYRMIKSTDEYILYQLN